VRTAVVHGRLVHRAQDAVRDVGRTWNLQKVASTAETRTGHCCCCSPVRYGDWPRRIRYRYYPSIVGDCSGGVGRGGEFLRAVPAAVNYSYRASMGMRAARMAEPQMRVPSSLWCRLSWTKMSVITLPLASRKGVAASM